MRKEFEPYKQDTKFTCAPATLKIGYKSLGFTISEKRLREELNTDKDGTYWRDVRINPGLHGFEKIYRSKVLGNLTYRDLRIWTKIRDGFVVVSFLNYRVEPPDFHFSLLRSALDDYVVLMDPGIGQLNRKKKNIWMQVWTDQEPSRPAMLVWKEE